jgi:hypothetical protein
MPTARCDRRDARDCAAQAEVNHGDRLPDGEHASGKRKTGDVQIAMSANRSKIINTTPKAGWYSPMASATHASWDALTWWTRRLSPVLSWSLSGM